MDALFSRAQMTEVRKPLSLLPECGRCGLLSGCKSPKMPAAGEGLAKVLVVGEAPGEKEDAANLPFVGPAGQYLQAAFRRSGFGLFKDCWVLNSLSCRPPKNRIDNDKKIDYCRPLVIKAITEHRPESIILFGKHAIQSVIGHLWKGSLGDMERWVGLNIPCREWNCWISPTYHPSHVMRMRNEDDRADPVKVLNFHEHVAAALKLDGRPWDRVPDYESRVRVELDDRAAAKWLDAVEYGYTVAFDFETTCLKPHGPHAEIVCCSVSDGKTSIAYPWQGEAIRATKELLFNININKVGWNLQMEDGWSRVHLGRPVNGWVQDGMITAHSLDMIRPEATGLKFQAFARLGVADYSASIAPYLKAEKGGGGNAPNRVRELTRTAAGLKKLLLYCGLDSLFEWIICNQQDQEF